MPFGSCCTPKFSLFILLLVAYVSSYAFQTLWWDQGYFVSQVLYKLWILFVLPISLRWISSSLHFDHSGYPSFLGLRISQWFFDSSKNWELQVFWSWIMFLPSIGFCARFLSIKMGYVFLYKILEASSSWVLSQYVFIHQLRIIKRLRFLSCFVHHMRFIEFMSRILIYRGVSSSLQGFHYDQSLFILDCLLLPDTRWFEIWRIIWLSLFIKISNFTVSFIICKSIHPHPFMINFLFQPRFRQASFKGPF